MFIKESVLKNSFGKLCAIDKSAGKSRQEKVSGLRHLLAVNHLMKVAGKDSIDLSLEERDNRNQFIEAVGNVVRIDSNNNYTKDFSSELGNLKDFGVGSNFFTTRLSSSRAQEIFYPGRPSPLIKLDREQVTLLPQYLQTLLSDYSLSLVKAPLIIWLLRNFSFSPSKEPLDIHELLALLKSGLESKYTHDLVDILIPTQAELEELIQLETNILTPTKADMGSLLQLSIQESETPTSDASNVLANDLDDDDEILEITRQLLERGSKGILYSGPPGTSKTWYALKIALRLIDGDMKRLARVQFHPSYSYEDFIEGLVATGSIGGAEPLFKPKSKTFVNLCEEARKDKDNNYFLIIDEFTRGDPSRIFGELLTYIESDYREVEFILPYSEKPFSVPNNVILLATMNPYDKSVVDLDSAMERRFEVVELNANVNLLTKFLAGNEVTGEIVGKIVKFFNQLNKYSEHGFGHAFFKDLKDEQDFLLLWNHKLKFILEKMFRFKEETYTELRQIYSEILTEELRERMK